MIDVPEILKGELWFEIFVYSFVFIFKMTTVCGVGIRFSIVSNLVFFYGSPVLVVLQSMDYAAMTSSILKAELLPLLVLQKMEFMPMMV